MKNNDSTFGYVSVNALMEFARNHVDGKVDCNDIARFPRSNVRNIDEQQSLQQVFGIDGSRLRELAEADREGRVTITPVKVGEKCYVVWNTKCGTRCLNSGDCDGIHCPKPKVVERIYTEEDAGRSPYIFAKPEIAARALSGAGEEAE